MANVNSTTPARPEFIHPAFQDIFPPELGDITIEVLLTRPLHQGMDFLALAPVCSELAAELLETRNTTARLALAGRLALALRLLRDNLEEDLTGAQRQALTSTEPPKEQACDFSPDADSLADYCHTLTQILLSRTLAPQQEKIMAGLLFELVNYQTDTLTAPQFWHAEGQAN
ncbi:hypothetical protein MT962_002772 [Franconibacter sp. IITDAS19]|uniref:hypothetical protein n=1 Tax=Franconibacter TaxID=1649295 RepID=UPI000A5C7611|nr:MULTISPECIES: hypothetical protein [Franconibacter]MCK1968931.1 hypothetical protein [Franconibacter sp. IITDAS19]GGD23587.1 hypothetical protein GCM10011513_21390 [Franconibacter daqui]